MFIGTQRTGGISTTDIINRILIDNEYYIDKLLKKGYTSSQLNISCFKSISIKFKRMIKCFRKIEPIIKTEIKNIEFDKGIVLVYYYLESRSRFERQGRQGTRKEYEKYIKRYIY